MTPEELENLANDMSSFNEDYVLADVIEGYNGADDDDISFDGLSKNPLDPNTKGVSTFKIKLSNTGSASEDRLLALLPGFYDTANKAKILDASGTAVAALLADGTVVGTGASALTASGQPRSIYELLEIIKRVPYRLLGIKMLVNSQDQFEQQFYGYTVSPFGKSDEMSIDPSEFKSSDQPNEYRAEINLAERNIAVGYKNVLLYKILAGKEVDMTFILGARYDIQDGLRKRAKRAVENRPKTRTIAIKPRPATKPLAKR